MSLYLDTSLLVSVLTQEPNTGSSQTWMAAQDHSALAISDWGVTEVSSALSLKVRVGALTAEQKADAALAFRRLMDLSLTVLPLSRSVFRKAASFCDLHELGIRSGDALHAAVCAEHGYVLCTRDRRLAAAASPLSIATLLL